MKASLGTRSKMEASPWKPKGRTSGLPHFWRRGGWSSSPLTTVHEWSASCEILEPTLHRCAEQVFMTDESCFFYKKMFILQMTSRDCVGIKTVQFTVCTDHMFYTTLVKNILSFVLSTNIYFVDLFAHSLTLLYCTIYVSVCVFCIH